MHKCQNLNEGVYLVQSGFRNDTALVDCPYISSRIEVYDAQSLRILDGASVLWSEVRRQYSSKRRGNREIITAVVVGIKHCKYFCNGKNVLCTLEVINGPRGSQVYGRPLNSKLPRFRVVELDPSLRLDDIGRAITERYYWGRFLNWHYQQQLPQGCLTGVFSSSFKTAEVETEAILYEMEISDKKCSLLNEHLLKVGREYLPVNGHRQFKQMVFTIDPNHSVDIEDGLSLETIDSETYEVGVHISDVCSFKAMFDRKEVAQRGTSIYLPHKTIHMLPEQLIELCALKSKKDRLAFSVFFMVGLDGRIKSSRFEKTIVCSVAQLSYEDAQGIICNTIDKGKLMREKQITQEELNTMTDKLRTLHKIAMDRRRHRANAQMFDKNQIIFELDKNNCPINIGLKKRVESEKIVEEFMIMANSEVAKKLVNDFGQHSLIIHHPRPSECSIENLNDYVSDYGVKFKADSMQLLEQQIRKLFEKEDVSDEQKQLLLMKAIQIQQFAIYTRYLNSNKGHYGLSLEYYTHFTSPVRRFADLLVHEQLAKCLANDVENSSRSLQQLQHEIELINKARTRSKKLKQLVVQCFMNLFLHRSNKTIRTKGFIVSLGLKSVKVYVPHYSIIKQIIWRKEISYVSRGKVQVCLQTKSGIKFSKQFQKNDSIDLEIFGDVHQQVQINLIVKKDDEEMII